MRHFYKKQIIQHSLCSQIPTMAQPLYPKTETSLAGSGERPGFLIGGLKIANKLKKPILWVKVIA